MWEIPLSILIIVLGLYLLQWANHGFVVARSQQHDVERLSSELQIRIAEFEEYKKKVDKLVLRSGFTL
jgi:hypothetical protein